MVYRIYVEKKPEFAHEGPKLFAEAKDLLGIKALEEVRADNLESYDGEGEIHQAHAVNRKSFEFGIAGEHRNGSPGEQFEYEKTYCSSETGPEHAEPVYLLDSAALACTEVVTGYGLHALVDAHHHHKEEEGQAVDYAVGPDGKVSSVFAELLVDEHRHKARGGIHQEGAKAYSE